MNLYPTREPSAFAPARDCRARVNLRAAYLKVLTWTFTLFNLIRLLAYLPTVLAIAQSGTSDQHSLWTWSTWVGANATMAGWLYEQNGRKVNRAVMVNMGNTVMCTITMVLVAVHRF